MKEETIKYKVKHGKISTVCKLANAPQINE